jgi:ubiquinone/menaquinone biosynthesis C-methylase UbiE/uncharacterized membrane protein
MSNVRKMTTAGLLLAIGILLPLAFHGVANAGAIFAPMHLSILLGGFILGPAYGALLGLLTPLLSFVTTGMPPVAVLPGMMVELTIYGAASGFFYRLIKTKNFYLDIYIALIISMLLGRSFGGLTNWILYLAGRSAKAYTWASFATAYFVLSWPAILIQIIAIPAILIALTKSHLISETDRYFNPEKVEAAKAREQAAFFDKLAKNWDEKGKNENEKISSIFANVALKEGDEVLDVACGTGVIDDYLLSKGTRIVGLDVSASMLQLAKEHHDNPNISYVQGDFYSYLDERKYDVIVCYNAYPHFADKDAFAAKAASLLKKGGHLYILHSMGRKELNEIHGCGKKDQCGLPLKSPKQEAFPFWKEFKKGRLEENENHYFVELIRR